MKPREQRKWEEKKQSVDKKSSHNWPTPAILSPLKNQEGYINPFETHLPAEDIGKVNCSKQEISQEIEEEIIPKEDRSEKYADSFEDDKEKSIQEEIATGFQPNEIIGLGKKERDILRESLTMMKFKQQTELPEEIVNEEIEVLGIPKEKAQPKPKIVFQSLFQNAVSSRPAAPIKSVEIDNDVIEAIRAENESVLKPGSKPVSRKEERVSKPVFPKFPGPIPQPAPSLKNSTNSFENLLERLQKLTPDQISKFFEVLDQIEKAPQAPQVKPEAKKFEIKKTVEPSQSTPALHKMPLPREIAPKTSHKKELVFRILSTWGHPHVVGLTELELFDTNSRRIHTSVIARHLGPGPVQRTSKLQNGKMFTNDERNMWVAYLPPPPHSIELFFVLPQNVPGIGGIAVWNYNKSSLDSVKGVRDAKVLLNGKEIWSGTIKRGNGRIGEDYSTEIFLSSSMNVFMEKSRITGNNEEAEIPKEVKKLRKELDEAGSRPISVPIWFQGQESGEKKRKPTGHEASRIDSLASVPASTKSGSTIEDTSVSKSSSRRSDRNVYEKFKPAPFSKPFKGISGRESEQRKPGGSRNPETQINPRDQSRERNMDSIMYFEASKPQRLLKRKEAKPVKEEKKFTVPKAEIKQKEEIPDILDEFVKNHELGEKKEVKQDYFSILQQQYTDSVSTFSIPELPKGQVLTFDILSTWDDQYYVGLAGIEIFTEEGIPLLIDPKNISAEPRDINILPEYGTDPRTPDKLVDGHYFTRSDLHVWLAPYTAGKRHSLRVDLRLPTKIAMIRVWNYNKSRIHAHRGVRELIVTLDEKNKIFMGEIRRAPGALNSMEQCCEILLFTENEEILSQIEQHDWISSIRLDESNEFANLIKEQPAEERPPTASKVYSKEEIEQIQRAVAEGRERPLTAAVATENPSYAELKLRQDKELAALQQEPIRQKSQMVRGSSIVISILETWGDLFYVGLTGLEILNEKNEKIPIDITNITATPKDLNSIPGHSGDYRTIDKLIDGRNITTDDRHMWLIPFSKGLSHTIMIVLSKPSYIQSFRFYNYNKSREDTNRGVKLITITVDEKLITPRRGIILKKAPGISEYDFSQTVNVPFREGWGTAEIAAYNKVHTGIPMIEQLYITPNFPTGFNFEFMLYSNYGDVHYIGLNGIEMFDCIGRPLLHPHLIPFNLEANPSSIQVLKGMENDTRTLEKLIDGFGNTFDDRHMWLTPFRNTKLFAATNREVAKTPNIITVSFQLQVAISAIRFHNYAKTPNRGVQEFMLFCDNRIIYRGSLTKSSEASVAETTIYFTNDNRLLDQLQGHIEFHPGQEQDVVMVNEKAIVSRHSRETKSSYEIERPLTSVVGSK